MFWTEPARFLQRAERNRAVLALLFVALAVLYVQNIADRGLWVENEGYYTLGARNITLEHWLVPQIHPGLAADKPPLKFWWIYLLSLAAGEVSIVTARLANIIPALLTLLVVRREGLRWNRDGAGLLAFLILGLSWEFWQNAIVVGTDMMLTCFLVIAWSAMRGLMDEGFSRGRWLALWGCTGLALLTKGPVAPVLTLGVAAAYAIAAGGGFAGAVESLKRLRPVSGLSLAWIPFGLWATAVLVRIGPEPLDVILLRHNIRRFTDAFDHQAPWYYFFGQLPVNLLPWSLFLPVTGVWLWKRLRAGGRSESRPEIFALCAVAVVFGFFSLSSSKQDYYLLPLMPWAALLIGASLSPGGWPAPTEARGTAPAGARERLVRGRTRYALNLSLVVYFGFLLFGGVVTEFLNRRKSPSDSARAFQAAFDPGELLVLYDEEDPRILYYIERPFVVLDDGDAARFLADYPKSRRSLDVMVEDEKIEEFVGLDPDGNWSEESRFRFKDDEYVILSAEDGKQINQAGPRTVETVIAPTRADGIGPRRT